MPPTEKSKALGKQFKNQDIDLVDELVFQLKNSSVISIRDKAQTKILEYFDSYLEKYVGLFTGAHVDLTNYDTRLFLGLFLSGRPKTLNNLIYARNYIRHMTQTVSDRDLKSEFVVVFLTVLSKHKIYEGVNALNPLTKLFRFRLKDWFNKYIRDPIHKSIDMDDVLFLDELLVEDGELSQDFDLSWVMSPSQKIYKMLNYYERYLLHLVYRNDLSVLAVANLLQRDKDTIKRHLSNIYAKVQEHYYSGKEQQY